jgi:hypothetical protein
MLARYVRSMFTIRADDCMDEGEIFFGNFWDLLPKD